MRPDLFNDNFVQWLEANGVEILATPDAPPFDAKIDLSKVKRGVSELLLLNEPEEEETLYGYVAEYRELTDNESAAEEATWD